MKITEVIIKSVITFFFCQQVFAQNQLIQQMINSVNNDSVFSTIRELQSFKTRYELSPQRDSAAEFIYNKFKKWNLQTESDWYKISIESFHDIDVVDQSKVWIVGPSQSILYSKDGGSNWEKRVIPPNTYLQTVDFINSKKGWAVGFYGVIIHTSDGGNNWVTQHSDPNITFTRVNFFDENLGIALGNYKILLKTTNGGMSWDTINHGRTIQLNDIKIVNPSNMFIVGNSGTILQSKDGGTTWKNLYSDPNTYFNSISFINEKLGWVIPGGGQILITKDGGNLWTKIISGIGISTFTSCAYFLDSLIGFTAGVTGIIQKTTDGGLNWTNVYYAQNTNFRAIKAIDKQRIIAIGGNTTMFMSSDSGLTWTSQEDKLPKEYFHTSRNLVATIPGLITPEKEYIAVAHYDAISDDPENFAPGADDNASGTSAVLEVARILKSYRFKSTIRLITVSGEERGLLGSKHYATQAKSKNEKIMGILNADMIGYPTTLDDSRLIVGSYFSRDELVDSAIQYNSDYSIGLNIVPNDNISGASDHKSFYDAGFSAILLVEENADKIRQANPHYHKQNDLIDYLKPVLVHKSTQLMLATIAELAEPISIVNNISPITQGINRFSLDQNYPNPFNPSTTFKFTIPKSSYVTLRVFNILGKEVAKILDDKLQAGVYSINWNPVEVPIGIYFYQLRAGNYSNIKKLVLIK